MYNKIAEKLNDLKKKISVDQYKAFKRNDLFFVSR